MDLSIWTMLCAMVQSLYSPLALIKALATITVHTMKMLESGVSLLLQMASLKYTIPLLMAPEHATEFNYSNYS